MKCPLCGAPAYAALHTVECQTRTCANYTSPDDKASRPLSDDDFAELQRQLEGLPFVLPWP